MTTFKLYFSQDNIRRIRLDTTPSYEQFTYILEDLYPHFHRELTIKYIDSDGDTISVDSEFEWTEMLLEMERESTLKLYIEEKPDGRYFKDGPTAETVRVYLDGKTKEAVEIGVDWVEQLKKNVPECVASLFKGGKIIPTHVPEFLKNAVGVKFVQENVVDLDVNVNELFELLHAKALSLLESVDVKDLEAGRDYLVATLKLVPDHMYALYNLACAESLLGNTKDALNYLEKAINSGFRDIDHMIADSDLANIRNTEDFKNLITRISEQFMPSQPEDEIIQVETEPEMGIIDEPVIQPVSEPQPVDLSESIAPLRNTYGEQLDSLDKMGFTADPDVLLLLLEQYNGDIDSVIQFLLGLNQ